MLRPAFLRVLGTAACWPLVGCGAHGHTPPPCDGHLRGFEPVDGLPGVLRIGDPSAAPLILLHELPGLTPADLALARCLAPTGLCVYVLVLFGEPGQDNAFLGYFQSCATSAFECSKLSATSDVLGGIERVVVHAHGAARRPVGAIGMCLTGILPGEPRFVGPVPSAVASTPSYG